MSKKEKIKQRRSQMLVHSYIYYQLNQSVVTDDTWQRWANELVKLQKSRRGPVKINWYDEAFADWDGSTGCHLPKDFWVHSIATRLLTQLAPPKLKRRRRKK